MEKQKAGKTNIRELLINNIYIFSALIAILIFTLLNPKFLSLYSIQNITLEIAPLLPMALGVAFVLYTGGIDLSTGAVAAATCVLTGLFVKDVGQIIILYILALATVAGLVVGLLVTKLKIPSFIATLCAQSIWMAVAFVVSGGGSMNIPMNMRHIVNWASDKFLGLPVMFWISMGLMLLCLLMERRTKIGKYIFATGANERAARLAGVNTDMAKICAFVFSALGSALAGIMYAYKLKSSVPSIGTGLNLMAISAVALGGTLMVGGRGSALRTLVGVVTVQAIASGMNLVKVDPLWQGVVYGIVLIFAVAINTDKGGRDLIIK